jgi:hypothetical protein
VGVSWGWVRENQRIQQYVLTYWLLTDLVRPLRLEGWYGTSWVRDYISRFPSKWRGKHELERCSLGAYLHAVVVVDMRVVE